MQTPADRLDMAYDLIEQIQNGPGYIAACQTAVRFINGLNDADADLASRRYARHCAHLAGLTDENLDRAHALRRAGCRNAQLVLDTALGRA
jgi:hypothetical protein